MQKLLVEVQVESVSINALLYIENIFCFLLCGINVLDVIDPLFEIVPLAGNESILKTVTHLLESSTLV